MSLLSYIKNKMNISNSTETVVGFLAVVDGIHCIAKSVKALKPVTKELDNNIRVALNTWELPENSKKYEKLQQKLNDLESNFDISNTGIPSFTSFSMILLEDVAKKLKGDKLEVVENIGTLLNKIHEYYDPEINMYECYETAEKMYSIWKNE